MFKRISISFLAVLMMSQTVLAAVSTPEEIIGENAGATIDFSLKGRAKEALSPFFSNLIDEESSSVSQEDRDKAVAVITQILAGERVYVSVNSPEDMVFIVKVTDSQWTTLIVGSESQSYGNTTIYTKDDVSLARISGMLVIGPQLDSIKKAIDRANANGAGSLAQSEYYRKLSTALISDRIIGVVLNWGYLKTLMKDLGEPVDVPGLSTDLTTVINRIVDIITHESYSVSETPTGYSFAAKILANEQNMKQHGISLNPSGNFVPHLYTVLPSQAPIAYMEGYNLKSSNDMSTKFLDYILGSDGTKIHSEIMKEISVETGIDLTSVINLFTREHAFAVQSNPNSLIPTVTFAANIAESRLTAEPILKSMIATLSSRLKKSMDEKDRKVMKVEKADDGKSVKITIDPTAFETPVLDHEKSVVVTIGITPDDLFVISNFPTIMDPTTRRGFGSDADFSSHPEVKTPVQSLTYLNARNTWKWLDRGFAAADPDLQTVKSYYDTAALLYSWKDAIMVSFSNSADASIRGAITIDSAEHSSFASHIGKQKDTDSDSDGVSDFEEKYLYKTNPGSSDCDHDGRSDVDAIAAGYDPCNNSTPVFKDISVKPAEAAPYYADEVVNLKRAGVVSGFPDGTFGAGKTMTRAEFVQMVVKAFKPSTNYFRPDLPFSDVHVDDWYYNAVVDAYNAGYISANKGQFRPGDSITRAEALMILNQASKKLSREYYSAQCGSNFDDVHSSDWFCEAVTNGNKLGITKGRGNRQFAPQATLTRGEGAVMIRRSLELDVQDAAEDTSNPFNAFSGL